jgi:hypothetical protein
LKIGISSYCFSSGRGCFVYLAHHNIHALGQTVNIGHLMAYFSATEGIDIKRLSCIIKKIKIMYYFPRIA